MKIRGYENSYTMWLSAQDTYDWAHKSGANWPCSQLSNRQAIVVVDSLGLCDLVIDGGRGDQDIDGTELDACVGDHLPAEYRHLWPIWK